MLLKISKRKCYRKNEKRGKLLVCRDLEMVIAIWEGYMDRKAFPRQRHKYPQKTVARKACSVYGGWWEFLGCPSRKRQLVMILKKAAAELECLHALYVNTCLLGLWVPLLLCVGNIRVIFFRVLHSLCLVVQFRLSMVLPFILLPTLYQEVDM